MNINDRFTLTAEQGQTLDAITADEPSHAAQDAAAALLQASPYTATALTALAAALRDDCCDDLADLLLSCAERVAEYEATVV